MIIASPNFFQPTHFKIFFQNINGWHSKKSTLKYHIRKFNPEIILLANTNVYDNQDKPIKFHPYKVYQRNTKTSIGRGVAILIKTDIKHQIINKKFDGDTLAIKVETSLGDTIVGVNYFPPSRACFPIRDLIWFSRRHSPTYLMADLNAHHVSFDSYTDKWGKVLYNMWLNGLFISPLNQVIYQRAKNTWTKIASGIAGDKRTFENISEIPIVKRHSWFPSSLERTRREKPPPLYTVTQASSSRIKQYYRT